MRPEYKHEILLRLKTAAGHLEAVRRMVEEEAYCVNVMKQLSAVQGTLDRVQQVLLRNHLTTCVSQAIQAGMGEQIIDELMGALKYQPRVEENAPPIAATRDCCQGTSAPAATRPRRKKTS